MNATLQFAEEEDLGYLVDTRLHSTSRQDLPRRTSTRQLSGKERVATRSRYHRTSCPTRNSGSHRPGKKLYGL